MSLNFNQKINATESAFITPRIMVESKKKNDGKEIPGGLVLKFGYIVKSIVDGNPAAFTDKTKSGAGADVSAIVKGLPDDSVYSLYMPAIITDRDSGDIKKWTLVVTVKQADILTACNALATINTIMVKAEEESNVIAKGATFEKYTVAQPVYFKDESGKGKTRGGSRVTTFTL